MEAPVHTITQESEVVHQQMKEETKVELADLVGLSSCELCLRDSALKFSQWGADYSGAFDAL